MEKTIIIVCLVSFVCSAFSFLIGKYCGINAKTNRENYLENHVNVCESELEEKAKQIKNLYHVIWDLQEKNSDLIAQVSEMQIIRLGIETNDVLRKNELLFIQSLEESKRKLEEQIRLFNSEKEYNIRVLEN